MEGQEPVWPALQKGLEHKGFGEMKAWTEPRVQFVALEALGRHQTGQGPRVLVPGAGSHGGARHLGQGWGASRAEDSHKGPGAVNLRGLFRAHRRPRGHPRNARVRF